jgi:hypothetical protein
MRVEKVVHDRKIPQEQRRPNGHANKNSGTKRGNKKKSVRRKVAASLGEEGAWEADDDEDDDSSDGGRPPVLANTLSPSNSSMLSDSIERPQRVWLNMVKLGARCPHQPRCDTGRTLSVDLGKMDKPE